MVAALSALQEQDGFDARDVEVCVGAERGNELRVQVDETVRRQCGPVKFVGPAALEREQLGAQVGVERTTRRRDQMRSIVVDYCDVLVTRTERGLGAVSNLCPHALQPLESGTLEDGTITCPIHSWCFDVRTGTALRPPGAPRAAPAGSASTGGQEPWVEPSIFHPVRGGRSQ